jgi:hypothetical protein
MMVADKWRWRLSGGGGQVMVADEWRWRLSGGGGQLVVAEEWGWKSSGGEDCSDTYGDTCGGGVIGGRKCSGESKSGGG